MAQSQKQLLWEAHFGWDASKFGLSFGIMRVGFAAVQAVLVRPVVGSFRSYGAPRAAHVPGAMPFLFAAV